MERHKEKPCRGRRSIEDDEEGNPFPMRKDPEDPTSVGDVEDPDPDLPLAEEAGLTWNQKKRKPRKESESSDV